MLQAFKALGLCGLLVVLILATQSQARAEAASTYLVKVKPGRSLRLQKGMQLRNSFPGDHRLFAVSLPQSGRSEVALKRLRTSLDFEYIEPNVKVRIVNTVPNDPMWGAQWDMLDIGAPQAWSLHKDSTDVVVAVMDTGIDYTHPDLAPNLWKHPRTGEHGYTATNGVLSSGGADDHGHGTHCAGTIGARGDDNVGMAGINWRTQLLSLKFLDASGGGEASDAILLIHKLIQLKKEGINIRLVSNSWGTNEYSRALEEAFGQLEAAGILSVCASGNDFSDADLSPMYPGAFESRAIISVNASDSSGNRAGFSNYGLA